MANNKVVIGALVLAAGAAIMFKDKLFGASAQAGNSYEGKVLRSPNIPAWYKVINGQRVPYHNYAAYEVDGTPPIIDVTDAQLTAIPENKTLLLAIQGLIKRG